MAGLGAVPSPRRVFVVGSGGREHALAWRLASEPEVERVFVAPGNPLMADVAQVLPAVAATDFDGLVDACRRLSVDLVVVGPEAPLVAELADALASAGVNCLGPTADAAQLEASKAFCRVVCAAAGVPMAEGAAFSEPIPALAYADLLGGRVVVKADGLAAGKGVTVCDDIEQARVAIEEALVGGRFGAAGARVVVEERLYGREASLIALCDGRDALLLPAARDHKRLRDGDDGPNTGGMGAYSPLEDLEEGEAETLLATVHLPVLAEMAAQGTPFRGFLYAGLMLTAAGPRLLEFNVRLGDPEAQAILPRLDPARVALAPLLAAAAGGRLAETAAALGLGDAVLPTHAGATVAVALASAGYPDAPRGGDTIAGVEEARAVGGLVFGAGVGRGADGELVTAGGRVLTVVGRGSDLAAARQSAYRSAGRIDFAGRQLRSDIGAAQPAMRSPAVTSAVVA